MTFGLLYPFGSRVKGMIQAVGNNFGTKYKKGLQPNGLQAL